MSGAVDRLGGVLVQTDADHVIELGRMTEPLVRKRIAYAAATEPAEYLVDELAYWSSWMRHQANSALQNV